MKRAHDSALSQLEMLPLPLLRRLLTAEAALVSPGMLGLVSKRMQANVDIVTHEPGFWQDLTLSCMPGTQGLSPDLTFFLANGRLGPSTSSDKAKNTAWFLHYKRICVSFINVVVRYYAGCRHYVSSEPVIAYNARCCNACETFFPLQERLIREQPSDFLELEVCNRKKKTTNLRRIYTAVRHSFGEGIISYEANNANTMSTIKITTHIGKYTGRDVVMPFLIREPDLPQVRVEAYGGKRCDIRFNNTSIGSCYYQERARDVLTKLLMHKLDRDFIVSGAQMGEDIHFSVNGIVTDMPAVYYMGDLISTYGCVNVMSTTYVNGIRWSD